LITVADLRFGEADLIEPAQFPAESSLLRQIVATWRRLAIHKEREKLIKD
jgi:hypothetical protein